jgi:polar amino acid transport system substrate-binding protein
MVSYSLALFVLGGLAAVPARGGDLAQLKERGRLVMLSYPHPVSLFVKQPRPGEFEGLDYDLVKTFARALGVELEVRPVTSFDDLIPELLAGRGDVVASSFSITRERDRQVDFTEPYFPVLVMVVVKKGSDIRRERDLAGRRGATVKGSSQEERMRQIPRVEILNVEQSRRNYEAVQSGRADFAFVDSSSALTVLPSFPDLEIAFSFDDVENYGFAVRPGSDLKKALDDHLSELRRGGVFLNLVRKHLGDKGVELFELARSKQGR